MTGEQRSMKAYLELMRYKNCIMAALAATIGVFIAFGIVHASTPEIVYPIKDSILVFLTVLLITGAGNAINDYCDINIDRINKPSRPIPSGRVSIQAARYFSLLLFATGCASAFLINLQCGQIALFNSILLIYYARTLKRTVFFGNLAVGYLTGSTFLFGGAVFFENGGMKAVFILFLLATLSTISREIVKDIEDMEGDRMDGARTLPIAYGPKISALIASLLGFIAVLASPLPYLNGMMDISYLYIVAIADLLFVLAVYKIMIKKDPSSSSSMFKMAMLFALISFLAGA